MTDGPHGKEVDWLDYSAWKLFWLIFFLPFVWSATYDVWIIARRCRLFFYFPLSFSFLSPCDVRCAVLHMKHAGTVESLWRYITYIRKDIWNLRHVLILLCFVLIVPWSVRVLLALIYLLDKSFTRVYPNFAHYGTRWRAIGQKCMLLLCTTPWTNAAYGILYHHSW